MDNKTQTHTTEETEITAQILEMTELSFQQQKKKAENKRERKRKVKKKQIIKKIKKSVALNGPT